MTKSCAVVGSPVAHSRSPVMHRAAYDALGLNWTYETIEVAEGGLTDFASRLGDEWAGLSVTAPLKREAAALATTATAVVRELGVANTLVPIPSDAGPPAWHAANTDVPGAVNALAERGVTAVRSVRILGGGATAASMLVVVRQLGATDVEVMVRSPEKVRLDGVTVRSLAEPPGDRVDLLISTLPADIASAGSAAWAESATALFDVSYDPWPTSLAASARAGQAFVSGLDLLAHQASLQVELMTGESVNAALLREAALAA
jgi:shikimate dehydrogenase